MFTCFSKFYTFPGITFIQDSSLKSSCISTSWVWSWVDSITLSCNSEIFLPLDSFYLTTFSWSLFSSRIKGRFSIKIDEPPYFSTASTFAYSLVFESDERFSLWKHSFTNTSTWVFLRSPNLYLKVSINYFFEIILPWPI